MGLKILNHLRTGAEHFVGRTGRLHAAGKPSLLRLLRTLEGMGYVSRDASRNYRIEVETSLTGVRESLRVLRKVAAGFCQEIQSRCGETFPLLPVRGSHPRGGCAGESAAHSHG